jgi:hypothetical protein
MKDSGTDNGGQGTPSDDEWTLGRSRGAGKHIVRQVASASAVDQRGAPIQVATRFPAQTPVYVTFIVRGLAPGEPHRLSVRWYLNDTLVPVAGSHTSTLITHDGPGFFSLVYPAPGAAQARLYWDEPIGDSSDTPNDDYLAQSVAFVIE